jgi:hypothetical protein
MLSTACDGDGGKDSCSVANMHIAALIASAGFMPTLSLAPLTGTPAPGIPIKPPRRDCLHP